MQNKLNNKSKNINNTKNTFSTKTRNVIFAVSTLAWLIVWWNIKSSLDRDYTFDNPIDAHRYEQIKNEFSFADRWFIKTIEDKNPNQILNTELKKHEKKILRIARQNINNWNLYFAVDLSKDNLTDIKTAIPSLSYLMDAMYGDWYSDILTDWQDHSDKVIVVDIKETDEWNIIRKLSIENKPKDEQANNKKIEADNNLA